MLKYNFESNSQLQLCFFKKISSWELYAKVQFWKQFTTLFHLHLRSGQVGNYMLKYNFESNSQHPVISSRTFSVGNYMLKYNFESNSQHVFIGCYPMIGWELYAKVQFWKQFTTTASKVAY